MLVVRAFFFFSPPIQFARENESSSRDDGSSCRHDHTISIEKRVKNHLEIQLSYRNRNNNNK